jgi:hypothetical protein
MVGRDFERHRTRLMSEAAFEEWFRRAGRPLDPALVWQEVRSILKGACLAPGKSAMLDRDQYFELGRKRAPLFVDLRPQIYRIAERYQQWLVEEDRLDSIDLCRLALGELRRRRAGPYDVVICDEVQDLTELEVGFVIALSARTDLAGVMLAGDAQQVLNPSGFRWAEVRRLAARHARQQAPPAVLHLRDPARSTAPLCAFAGALSTLRRDVFGRGDGEQGEDELPATAPGPFPVQIFGDEATVLAAIVAVAAPGANDADHERGLDRGDPAHCGYGAGAGADAAGGCAVLVADAVTAQALRERLHGCTVLTVAQAKGLEFDTVVMWRLVAADADLVDRFLRGEARGEREARFARLLRWLYVAATRARRCLAVYEGPAPHPFWGRAPLAAALDPLPAEHLPRVFRAAADPEEWERQGDFFATHDLPRQAAECYRRAGLVERETATLAQADEARQDWAAALARWQALGGAAPAREAPLLARLGRFAAAADRYRAAGQRPAAQRCDLLLLESRGAWTDAARGWEDLGDDTRAARCWAAGGQRRAATAAALRAAEAAGDWPTAAAGWLDLGEHDRAARAFTAAADHRGAAHAAALAHREAGRWPAAAAAFRLCGRRQDAHLCLAQAFEAAGRPRQAARHWLRLGDPASHRRAVDLLVEARAWLDVARLEPAAPPPATESPGTKPSRVLVHIQQLLAASDQPATNGGAPPDSGIDAAAVHRAADATHGSAAAAVAVSDYAAITDGNAQASTIDVEPMHSAGTVTDHSAAGAVTASGPAATNGGKGPHPAFDFAPTNSSGTAADHGFPGAVAAGVHATPNGSEAPVATGDPAAIDGEVAPDPTLVAAPTAGTGAVADNGAAAVAASAGLARGSRQGQLADGDAAALLATRRVALTPQLPEVPWFLAGAEERRARAELQAVERLELRRRAIVAERAGAWSRASRCWRRAGDLRRADGARDRRIAGLADPLRQVRAWWLTGDPASRRRAAALAAGAAARGPLLTVAVAALAAEGEGRWQTAAELWARIARRSDVMRCMARVAAFRDQQLPPARGGRRRS